MVLAGTRVKPVFSLKGGFFLLIVFFLSAYFNRVFEGGLNAQFSFEVHILDPTPPDI